MSDDAAKDPYRRLADLGLALPDPFPSFGEYVMAVVDGETVHSAGHVPFDGERLICGKLGAELDVAAGVTAAHHAALGLLATLHHELGDLGRVRRILSVTGTVNATPDFTDHTAVVDGASKLLVAVFGDAGRHARLAVGVNSLPADMALEIQAVVALHPAR
jgi:enamine deaminase RidA (YjgF/YER057c/UK114 family)